MAATVKSLDERIDAIYDAIVAIGTRLDGLSARVDTLSTRVDALTTRVDKLEEKVTDLTRQFIDFHARIDNSMKFIRWIGVFLAGVALLALTQLVSVAQNYRHQQGVVTGNQVSIAEIQRINAEQTKQLGEIGVQLAELKAHK